MVQKGRVRHPELIAGVDLAYRKGGEECLAGVVLWDVAAGAVVEQHTARRTVRFPYVPGLLSFREAPAVLAALRKLRREPDVFMFDGHGLAHPRRFGLACHLGVLLDRPSFGCAKSILVGEYVELAAPHGSAAPIRHKAELVGMAVRTRANVRPVFVSVGHRISLASAVEVTLLATAKFRIPEPLRLADQLVGR